MLEPEEKKVKVNSASSAAAHGASSGSGSYTAHGASLDAAATITAQASMNIPVAQASLDRRGKSILEDWVAPLREVVQPKLQALGSQQRALVADELLSGTCSAVYSLLAAELVHTQHRLMVEKDAEAIEFCREQVSSSKYVVPHLQTLFHDHPGGSDAPPGSSGTPPGSSDALWTPADLLVAGIVCKPFSIANAKRRKAGSVENHPDLGIGGLVVNYILERLPLMFVLENVLGWGQQMCPAQTRPSAMESVEQRFRDSGIYKTVTLELGTHAWSQGRRTSLFIVGIHHTLTDASSDAAQQRFTETLQAIVLRRSAQGPARWDQWLLRPGDTGFSMMYSRFAAASNGGRCKKDHAFTYFAARPQSFKGDPKQPMMFA